MCPSIQQCFKLDIDTNHRSLKFCMLIDFSKMSALSYETSKESVKTSIANASNVWLHQ